MYTRQTPHNATHTHTHTLMQHHIHPYNTKKHQTHSHDTMKYDTNATQHQIHTYSTTKHHTKHHTPSQHNKAPPNTYITTHNHLITGHEDIQGSTISQHSHNTTCNTNLQQTTQASYNIRTRSLSLLFAFSLLFPISDIRSPCLPNSNTTTLVPLPRPVPTLANPSSLLLQRKTRKVF